MVQNMDICLPIKLSLLKQPHCSQVYTYYLSRLLPATFVRDRLYERNYQTLAGKLPNKTMYLKRLLAYFFLTTLVEF